MLSAFPSISDLTPVDMLGLLRNWNMLLGIALERYEILRVHHFFISYTKEH